MLKGKAKKKEKYNDENYNNREQAKKTCEGIYGSGIDNPSKSEEVKELLRSIYHQKHDYNPITTEESISIINEIDSNAEVFDIYNSKILFTKYVELLYNKKKQLLHLSEIGETFDRHPTTIGKRVHELELEKYFDIRDSLLELFFKDFLVNNNYKEKEDFTRHNHILRTKDNNIREIDFLFQKYNMGFEINDIGTHNINDKDINYHYSKTKMAKDQHNIRLIHIWEWELLDLYWHKLNNWIQHLLNQNKIQLNIFNDDNYDIRLVNKEDECKFLNQYSITSYQNSDMCIGVYHNDELIQIILFKGNILSICVKFGYNIIEGTKDIIDNYIKIKNLTSIITCIDLSKFTGKTFEDLGFNFLQYRTPTIIAEKDKEIANYKQLYNCGYNIYEYKC